MHSSMDFIPLERAWSGCSQGEEVKKASRSHYMWAFTCFLLLVVVWVILLACLPPSQSARKKFAVLETSIFGFALVHWEYAMSRAYESSFRSCSDIAVLKPQHQLNINQALDAKFVGPAR